MTLQKLRASPTTFDSVRAARMGGYGFCFYGPYQYFWYGLLDKYFPTRSLPHFGTKVNAASSIWMQTSILSKAEWLPQAYDAYLPLNICVTLPHSGKNLSHS